MGYGGCKQRMKGIDKCKKRFCTILRIIKIIKKGGVRFDSKPSKDGEKDKKRRKKEKKKIVFGAGFEPTTLRLQILHLTS